MNTNLKTVVIRADASPKIGVGHVMRCMSLGKILSNLGFKIVLACCSETVKSVGASKITFMEIIEISTKKSSTAQAQELFQLLPNGCGILICDTYAHGFEFESALRGWTDFIVVFDDLAEVTHDCDILINSSLGFKASNYNKLVPSSCNLLLGPRYAPVRSIFSELRKKIVVQKNEIVERIAVSLGGTDPQNNTEMIVSLIHKLLPEIFIDIYLMPGAIHYKTIEKVTKNWSENIILKEPKSEIAYSLSKADLVIGAAGSSVWERCTLGLPSMVIVTADNQRHIAAGLKRQHAALVVSENELGNKKIMSKLLKNICTDFAFRKRLSIASKNLCDGNGALRITKKILEYSAITTKR